MKLLNIQVLDSRIFKMIVLNRQSFTFVLMFRDYKFGQVLVALAIFTLNILMKRIFLSKQFRFISESFQVTDKSLINSLSYNVLFTLEMMRKKGDEVIQKRHCWESNHGPHAQQFYLLSVAPQPQPLYINYKLLSIDICGVIVSKNVKKSSATILTVIRILDKISFFPNILRLAQLLK